MDRDYYKILGIKKGATRDQVRRAYRVLSKNHHPDVNGGDSDEFLKIKKAHDVLLDQKGRKFYDTYGCEEGGEKFKNVVATFRNIIKSLMKKYRPEELPYQIEKTIVSTISKYESDIRRAEEGIAGLEMTLTKLRKGSANKDLLKLATETLIDDNKAAIAASNNHLDILNTMKKIVEGYDIQYPEASRHNTWNLSSTTGTM
jgi:DnaJ-class molecular chaperone